MKRLRVTQWDLVCQDRVLLVKSYTFLKPDTKVKQKWNTDSPIRVIEIKPAIEQITVLTAATARSQMTAMLKKHR